MSLSTLLNNIRHLFIIKKLKSSPLYFYGAGVSLFLFISLFLFSCGLPNLPYLSEPELYGTASDPDSEEMDLIFWNADENNTSIFSGYEIYYKIYDPINASSTDNTATYNEDYTTISASSTGSSAIFENAGFSRLFFSDSYDLESFTHNTIKPSFSLEDTLIDEHFMIRLKFIQDTDLPGDSFYAETYDTDLSFSDTPYFYRRVTNSSSTVSSNKAFDTGDFNIYDSDLPDSVELNYSSDTSGDYYLYISFYIMSYGRDSDDILTSVYSIPLYLGTLKFDCILTND